MPVTGQPDFAHLMIDFVPGQWLLESKSLKLYIASFRNHGAFHEDCTVSIGKRIAAEIKPKWLRIGGYWYPRGGIRSTCSGRPAPCQGHVGPRAGASARIAGGARFFGPVSRTPASRSPRRVTSMEQRDAKTTFFPDCSSSTATSRCCCFATCTKEGPLAGQDFWSTPGGGVEDGETFQQAAIRELKEETGMTREFVGEPVAERAFVMQMPDGEFVEAQEQYFLVAIDIAVSSRDGWTDEEAEVIADHRWWSKDELRHHDRDGLARRPAGDAGPRRAIVSNACRRAALHHRVPSIRRMRRLQPSRAGKAEHQHDGGGGSSVGILPR